jgi:cytochrome bd-type quinol oxidase subunit 1
MAYEVLLAFFLEASFLGVLLFGRRIVPAWAHFFAVLMVAFGTLFSSFWILAANAWMQTPQGYKLVNGRFVPVDWIAIIFNPSFPCRLLHNVTAFYITTAFVVMGVGAWLLRRSRAAGDACVDGERAFNIFTSTATAGAGSWCWKLSLRRSRALRGARSRGRNTTIRRAFGSAEHLPI